MAKKTKVGLKVPTKNELAKRYPGSRLASENDDSHLPWLPSRFIAFNYQLGGGIPFGKILEIYGEESSGKSVAALSFASVTTDLNGIVLWADAEQAFTNDWAQKNNIDLTRVEVFRETSVESISDWVADMAIYWRSILVNNEPILLVVDSMAALDCMENINSKMVDSKADMGNRAKAIYKMFRVRSELLFKLGVSQIYINQLRKNLSAGMFGDPDCLHYDTMVPFTDGTSMKVGDIVKQRINKKVWSLNEITNQWEEKPIIGWVEKEPTTNWLSIVTNGPGTSNGLNGIVCTPRHKCLTQRGWVKAGELNLEDRLITKYESAIGLEPCKDKLSAFMYGMFIGDSSIRVRGKNTACIHLQDNNNKEYVQWKMSLLPICFKKKKTVRNYDLYSSAYTVELALIKDKIGERDPLKVFNSGLHPITLAVWYMDDGHLDKRGNITMGISHKRTNIEELCRLLSCHGLECKPKGNRYISFSKEGSGTLSKMVSRYIPECMQYKLRDCDKGRFKPSLLSDMELDYSYKTLQVEIKSISKAGVRNNKKPYKYDLTIADNHNFLAGSTNAGILVHNTTPGGKALQFYASQRIGFYGGKQIVHKIKGKERKVGRLTSIRVKKNKVAPPRTTIKGAPMYYNPDFREVGFDPYYFLQDVFLELEVIEKTNGGVYKYKGETLCRGEEKFLELIEKDDDLRRKLLKKAGINTIGTTRRKLEKLTTNLFPVDGDISYESQSDTEEENEDE